MQHLSSSVLFSSLHRSWAAGLLALGTLLPHYGSAQTVKTFDTGAAATATYHAGPIYRSAATSAYYGSRFAYLYDAAELSTAGVPSGAVITKVEWEKATADGANRTASFSILMRNTAKTVYLTTATAARWDTLTATAATVYTNAAYTVPAATGYQPYQLTTPFVYTGKALEIYTDWLMSSTGTGNASTGPFSWSVTTVVDHILGICNTTTPTANLSPTTNSIGTLDNLRPKLRITYNTVTGVQRQTVLQGQLYPNPTTGPVQLQLGSLSAQGQPVRVAVYDAQGRQVYSTTASAAHSTLDLSKLAAGIYQVQLRTATQHETHQVVVAH